MNDGLEHPGSDDHTELCPTPTNMDGLFDPSLLTKCGVNPDYLNYLEEDTVSPPSGGLAQLQTIAVNSKLADLLPH